MSIRHFLAESKDIVVMYALERSYFLTMSSRRGREKLRDVLIEHLGFCPYRELC